MEESCNSIGINWFPLLGVLRFRGRESMRIIHNLSINVKPKFDYLTSYLVLVEKFCN